MEAIKKKNWWWASDLQQRLEYKDVHAFQKIIYKAVEIFILLDIPYFENVIPQSNEEGEKAHEDFQLSRFACFLVVMQCDAKKEAVAEAQAKFLSKTKDIPGLNNHLFELDRFEIRNELADANRWLSSEARKAGLTDYARFTDAGYRGLYNQSHVQLLQSKKLNQKDAIQDRMGKMELAANLLKATLTKKAIRDKNVKGQNFLEQLHFQVGKDIRTTIQRNSAELLEQLPLSIDLDQVKSDLKKAYKTLSVPQQKTTSNEPKDNN